MHMCEISYSVTPSVSICKIAQRRSKFAVEGLESKDKGQIYGAMSSTHWGTSTALQKAQKSL